jgi:PAS domain S-box-containing protein
MTNEEKYRRIIELSPVPMVVHAMGTVVLANQAVCNLIGANSPDDVIGTNVLDFVHPDSQSAVQHRIKLLINGTRKHTEVLKEKLIRLDGTIIDVEIVSFIIDYNGQPSIQLILQDITDRRRTEEDLNYSNYILRTVTDNASLGLFMMGDNHHCTFMNAAAERITGYTFAEMQSMDLPLHDVIHHTHPDGRPYPISECPIDRSLSTTGRQKGEDVFVRPDGTFYPVRFTASPLIKNKKTVGTILEIEDLTEILETKNAYIEASSRRKELEEMTNTLAAQRVQLLALNQSKDEFISLASHQLRTPATGVKQYVAMALDGYAGELSPQLRMLLERAYENNERQLTIVNDLLKVAQIDAGKVQLQKEQFDVIELIGSILQDDASKFTERDQRVTYTHAHPAIMINADKDRLRMVIENIIDNASKYTPLGKSIKISVRQLKTKVAISIKDTGVGIEQKDIEKIFDKFVRIDNPLSTHVGGTGLGLYWAQRIIALHNGTITVKSEIEEGSTFTITLPLS